MIAKKGFIKLVLVCSAVMGASGQSLNWEGQTGIYTTPLASVAASKAGEAGRPVVGYHYLNGGDTMGAWHSVSVTEGFAGRAEFGYTRTMMSAGSNPALSPLWKGGYNIVHGKVNIVPSELSKKAWMPAVSAGFVARMGDGNVSGVLGGNQTYANGDIYMVATKVITQTKKVPILLNFGYKGTNASALGLAGNAPGWKGRAFGGVGFVVTGPAKSTLIFAAEISQQQKSVKNLPGVVMPTMLAYAVRIVPTEKSKFNVDLGMAQIAGRIAPGVDLKLRKQLVLGVSYAF